MPRQGKPTKTQGKWSKYTPAPHKAEISWDEVSQPLIGEMVGAVTRDGSAVLLGTTRDGGALVVTVCAGDERAKFYASSLEEVASMMQNIISVAEG